MLHFLPVILPTVLSLAAVAKAPDVASSAKDVLRANLKIEIAVVDSHGRRFVNFKRRDGIADEEKERKALNPKFVNADPTFYCEGSTCWQQHTLGASIGAPNFFVTFAKLDGKPARLETDLKAGTYKLICSDTGKAVTSFNQIVGKALATFESELHQGKINLVGLASSAANTKKPSFGKPGKSPCP